MSTRTCLKGDLIALERQPLVSVVTPVYNGERYLAECIESVLAQTYENWEYLILNNCSTDNTLDIAQAYASTDSRIRVQNNIGFLPLIKNWNHSIRAISPDSKYCKILHADDYFYPNCLDSMVEMAEANPNVGIVGSYRLRGSKVHPQWWPHLSSVVSGREVCKVRLRGGPLIFGSPTSLLLRSDLVRERDFFYDESNLHADSDVCFNMLRDCDFGFVPRILTFTRLHDNSITSSFAGLGTERLGRLRILTRYGSSFFDEEEFRHLIRAAMVNQYKFLCSSMFKGNARQILNYHRTEIKYLGHPFKPMNFAKALLSLAFEASMKSPRSLKNKLRKSVKLPSSRRGK